MPEGHTIHRLAADHRDCFLGGRLAVSSPQGTFAGSAALLDGRELTGAEAHGKHLFLSFGEAGHVHIHLGLFGKVTFTPPVTSSDDSGDDGGDDGGDGGDVGDDPEPGRQSRTATSRTAKSRTVKAPSADTVRLRLDGPGGRTDLRGPATCALITDAEKDAVHARLGPDPLREQDGPETAYPRIARSRTSLAALLLDQKIIAGVGNVYRAEVLFRHRTDPYLPGCEVGAGLWRALWDDLAALMAEGVRANRIDTVRPEHTPEAMNRPPRVDDHGGEVYVYRRAGRPCLVCGHPVSTAELAARNLFWCPRCQQGA